MTRWGKSPSLQTIERGFDQDLERRAYVTRSWKEIEIKQKEGVFKSSLDAAQSLL